jgi:hypothetical protein
MKLNDLIKFSLVLCLVGITATPAMAYNSYGDNWRDYYPDSCQELQDATTNPMDCIMCHGAGFSLNPYGQDFKEADRDFAAIESFDSDGDGRTNGEEILIDCTLPGDAISPADLNIWGNIKALYR